MYETYHYLWVIFLSFYRCHIKCSLLLKTTNIECLDLHAKLRAKTPPPTTYLSLEFECVLWRNWTLAEFTLNSASKTIHAGVTVSWDLG
jgi:hypothetical protein